VKEFILMKRWRADLILLGVAMIWGSAFAVQRVAGRTMDPFTFNGLRFLLGGLLILPFTSLLKRKHLIDRDKSSKQKNYWFIYVTLAGLLLFGAGGLQQAGLETTTAGNAGFITSLYVVVVPLLLALIWKQKVRWSAWVAAGLAVLGSLLLSTGGMLQLASGDALELMGAVLWALHVILVGRAMQRLEVLSFAAGQYLVAGVLNLGVSLLTRQSWAGLSEAWWTVIYIGLLSTAIGYTLQVYGQRTAPPADAAILLSMESVFAALTGYIFLGEDLAAVQILGCGLILGAILLAQIRVDRPGSAKIN
jgi:drug/metabolite transporter (DMT)-like permease